MHQSIDKEILKKYIQGQCNATELALVRQFLLTPGSQEVLDELILEESSEEWDALLEQPVNADQQMMDWETRFEQRKNDRSRVNETGEQEEGSIPLQPAKGLYTFILKYAAVWLVLLSGAGFYAVQQFRSKTPLATQETASAILKEFRTKTGERATLTLSDGTVIYLGPESILKYPETFKGTSRQISLTGEAFFEVAHNPAKPFRIQSGKLRTTVLGTSFKVNAFEGQMFEVKVATGKVRVDRTDHSIVRHLAILTPGQLVRLPTADSEPVLAQLPVSEVLCWKASKMVFRDNTLQEIARELERAYDVSIRFSNAEKAREVVTISLQLNVPLQETLQLLSKGTHFSFHKNGKNITIK